MGASVAAAARIGVTAALASALWAVVAVTSAVEQAAAQAEAPAAVLRMRVDGPITAASADYVERVLAEATDRSADAVLIELDTPGGDSTSMQRISSAMLNADVPTLVWVGPSGARAASAGTFVVLSAAAAGMAPNTVIGAASPVGSGGEDLPETLRRKITEDTAAEARALGADRSPAVAEWAERAVRDAASATAEEALAIGLVDAIADRPEALFDAIAGREVRVDRERRVLDLAGARIEDAEMTAGESALSLLIHPAVALLLLTIGVNAILIELSQPGGYVAGVIGVLAIALGLYSLGALEANLLGLGFLAAAVALFALEVKASSHGLLALAGLGLFVFGSVLLFDDGPFAVPWLSIAVLTVATGAFLAVMATAAVRAMKRPPTTGAEGLIGATGAVRSALAPVGKVLVLGETWDACTEDGSALDVGATVEVVARDGFTLVVRPAGYPGHEPQDGTR